MAAIVLRGTVSGMTLQPPWFPERIDDWRGWTEVAMQDGDDPATAVVHLAGRIAEATTQGALADVAAKEPDEWQEAVGCCQRAGRPIAEALEAAVSIVDVQWSAIEALGAELAGRMELTSSEVLGIVRPLLVINP